MELTQKQTHWAAFPRNQELSEWAIGKQASKLFFLLSTFQVMQHAHSLKSLVPIHGHTMSNYTMVFMESHCNNNNILLQ